LSKIDNFGIENSKEIKNWLIRHEKNFGIEFEERYDPFTIIIKLCEIKTNE